MKAKKPDPISRGFRQDFPQFVERAKALGVRITLSPGKRDGRARVYWLDGYRQLTGYAINKPSDIISILNILEQGDILFIDEIHRLKPNIEEVLYIAMEDFVIDMVMPE